MKSGALYRRSDGVCVVRDVLRTDTAWDRLRGLLGRQPLQAGQGMLITPCRNVHTLGMRYALDLVFLDAQWRVCKQVANLAPARFAGSLAASMTLELAGGALRHVDLPVGEVLEWRAAC